MVSILGVENQAVSLAACHLLQVMFDALKEGVKKGFRGKEGAIIVGEWKQVCVLWCGSRGEEGAEPARPAAAAGCSGIRLVDSILLEVLSSQGASGKAGNQCSGCRSPHSTGEVGARPLESPLMSSCCQILPGS